MKPSRQRSDTFQQVVESLVGQLGFISFRFIFSRPAFDIVAVEIEAPEYHSAFGPCVDGIVVAREPSVLMEEHSVAQFKSYDVIFGVTAFEVSTAISVWKLVEYSLCGAATTTRRRLSTSVSDASAAFFGNVQTLPGT